MGHASSRSLQQSQSQQQSPPSASLPDAKDKNLELLLQAKDVIGSLQKEVVRLKGQSAAPAYAPSIGTPERYSSNSYPSSRDNQLLALIENLRSEVTRKEQERLDAVNDSSEPLQTNHPNQLFPHCTPPWLVPSTSVTPTSNETLHKFTFRHHPNTHGHHPDLRTPRSHPETTPIHPSYPCPHDIGGRASCVIP